jgi:hypothetical protein
MQLADAETAVQETVHAELARLPEFQSALIRGEYSVY